MDSSTATGRQAGDSVSWARPKASGCWLAEFYWWPSQRKNTLDFGLWARQNGVEIGSSAETKKKKQVVKESFCDRSVINTFTSIERPAQRSRQLGRRFEFATLSLKRFSKWIEQMSRQKRICTRTRCRRTFINLVQQTVLFFVELFCSWNLCTGKNWAP